MESTALLHLRQQQQQQQVRQRRVEDACARYNDRLELAGRRKIVCRQPQTASDILHGRQVCVYELDQSATPADLRPGRSGTGGHRSCQRARNGRHVSPVDVHSERLATFPASIQRLLQVSVRSRAAGEAGVGVPR